MTLANGKQMIHGSESVALIMSEVNAQDWHVRYGHLPLPAFRHILKAPPALRNPKLECGACQKGKSTKAPSRPSGHCANRILDTLHSDLCGTMEIKGVAHQRYICTLIDEHSRFTMLRSLPSKAEAPAALLDMIAAMETQTGYKAKNLKTDKGGEYRSAELLRHLRAKGISLKETVAYDSQTNAIAERTNRTIITMARTALLDPNLPKYLWPEAIAHSTYPKNRTPHQTLDGKSPVELFLPQTNIQQQRSKFWAFGESVWIHFPHTIGKLTARSMEGHIVGYTASSGIYRVYTKEKRVTTTNEPRHRSLEGSYEPALSVPFDIDPALIQGITDNDTIPPNSDEGQRPTESTPLQNQEEPLDISSPQAEPLRWSGRTRRLPERYRHDGSEQAYTISVNDALAGPDSKACVVAMEEEKEQLKKYGVYEELDKLPHGKQTVDTKWVLREKFDQAGKLQKRKARLTARGFTQVYGLQYDDTYASVTQPDSWRSLLILALRDRWIILQANIVAAYLNTPLKHEIYISDPSVTKGKVWRLHKALYGLKQSAFEWNTTMTMLFCRSSLLPMKSDPACYVGDHIRVPTHVDDYLIVARGVEDLVEFTQVFEQNVEIDHKGKPSSFLNIECHWETIPTSPSDSTLQTALRLTQIRAIEALCAEYGITYGVSSPMSLNDDLTAPTTGEKLIDPKPYCDPKPGAGVLEGFIQVHVCSRWYVTGQQRAETAPYRNGTLLEDSGPAGREMHTAKSRRVTAQEGLGNGYIRSKLLPLVDRMT